MKSSILILAFAVVLPAFGQQPTAQEILKEARLSQTEQHRALRGRLRNGPASIPFRLVMEGGEIRYEFSDPAQTLRLRLGEKGSRLEEITRGGAERVTPARFDQKVRNTDISYEDLTLHFLYWPDGEVLGEDTQLTRRCWKLRLRPPTRKDSQYGLIDLWVEQQSGALLQADAYGWDGKLAKRFKVISAQKLEGVWLLKQMRIEAMEAGKSRDRTPTYLEILGME
jgi:outer membrane lipoprotein-sorting protein